MGGDGTIFTNGLLRYLKDVWRLKHQNDSPNEHAWKIIKCKDGVVPQQSNSFDCGVFTCMFADFLSINQPLNFGQSEASAYWDRIALSIITSTPISNPVLGGIAFPSYETNPSFFNEVDDSLEVW